jgi:hypothetical protein
LAGTSDNPNHIVAVCVEENTKKDGLSVVLAINKTGPRDAEDVLDTIKLGLQGVFNKLGEVRYGMCLSGLVMSLDIADDSG